ncbi:MAG: peptidase M28, partial [Bacteroidota bacterium]
MKKIYLLTLIGGLILSCGIEKEKYVSKKISEESLKKHLITLSSDDFQGRKPFTEGEEKTTGYLKDQFETNGLEPGNGDSYFQEVPLVELTAIPSDKMTIRGNAGTLELDVLDDFVAYTEQVVEKVSLDASELVFAGYGVVAPEYGWNDYEGLDVKGKTVVVLVN